MDAKKKKTLKRVCKCEHCGNEAEMMVTCSLVDEDELEQQKQDDAPVVTRSETDHSRSRVKGVGTCSQCGNEADMWVDL